MSILSQLLPPFPFLQPSSPFLLPFISSFLSSHLFLSISSHVILIFHLQNDLSHDIRYMARDVVTKLEVVNKKYVRVYTQTSPMGPVCHFRIGDVPVFEERLAQAQVQLQRPGDALLPVTYTEQTNWLYVPSYPSFLLHINQSIN